MTANPERRRRSTRLAAATTVVVLAVAVVAGIVAVSTLRSSQAGEAVEIDTRPVVVFPETPNAALGVVDDQNRLTSVVVATLDPSGAGGSLVTVPVNLDTTSGFGPSREPVSQRSYAPGDDVSVDELTSRLESLLTLTIERAAVLGPDELLALLEPIGTVEVDLPERVTDADGEGSGFVAASGERDLEPAELVEVLTAIDADGASYEHHATDVAVWTAIADAGSGAPGSTEVPLDEFDRPTAPTSFDELMARLFTGEVAARDLAIDVDTAAVTDNPDDTDFVLLDRRDALLVFGEISPSLVSTPNSSLSFQIVAPFSDEQLSPLGEEATTVGIVREFIGELLFAQANVVSVRTAANVEGAGEVTRLEVLDESYLEEVEAVAPVLFGEVEVVVATRVIDGVDVIATLGTDFIDHRAELAAEEAADAEEVGDSSESDFDVSTDDMEDTDDDSSDGDDGSDGAGEPATTDGSSADTVPSDE